MAYQYKRRKLSLIRNFWVYRRLIGSAMLLGIMLWFIWANDTPVIVAFPFHLGHLSSSVGVVILLSAMFGSLVTILIMTVVMAVRKIRSTQGSTESCACDRGAAERPASSGLRSQDAGGICRLTMEGMNGTV